MTSSGAACAARRRRALLSLPQSLLRVSILNFGTSAASAQSRAKALCRKPSEIALQYWIHASERALAIGSGASSGSETGADSCAGPWAGDCEGRLSDALI